MRKEFYRIDDGILFACKRINIFGYDVVDLAEQQVPIFNGNKVYEWVVKGTRVRPHEELRDFLTGDLRYIGRSNFIEIWKEEDLKAFFNGIRKV